MQQKASTDKPAMPFTAVNMDVHQWRINDDGGFAVIKQGEGSPWGPSLNIMYDAQKPWSNCVCMTDIPSTAIAITLAVKPLSVTPGAMQFMWMMEADNDGHLASVKYEHGDISGLPIGEWQRVMVPLTSFNFEPRGDGKPNMLSVNRIMIGLNGSSCQIEVADVGWLCKSEVRTAEAPTQAWVYSQGKWSYREGSSIKPAQIAASAAGRNGTAVIFADNVAAVKGYSDPHVISDRLVEQGYGTLLCSAEQMAQSGVLDQPEVTLLVMPYGPIYPSGAEDAIRSYLKRGGAFLCMGGYTLDAPSSRDDAGILMPSMPGVTAAQIASKTSQPTPLNGRTGVPADTMVLAADQVCLFDPTWRFKASKLVNTDGTEWSDTSFGGFASCCLLGNNNPVYSKQQSQYVSLIKAYNVQGYCADALGVVQHFDGPFKGGTWAFTGLQTHDLFAKNSPFNKLIPQITERYKNRICIESVTTDKAIYSGGSTARITAVIGRFSKLDAEASLKITVMTREGETLLNSDKPLLAGSSEQTIQIWSVKLPTQTDLVQIQCELMVNKQLFQELTTGVCIKQPVSPNAFAAKWKDNLLHKDNRPVLAIGTNQTGMVFNAGKENPWTWDHDLQKMADYGLSIMRVLHFFPQQNEKGERYSLEQGNPEWVLSKLDAMLQLCQRHGIVLLLSIHDWVDQDLSPNELQLEHQFAKELAWRYKGVPGFMIDVQNEPYINPRNQVVPSEKPHVIRRWNEYLRKLYVSDASLKSAWSISPPEAAIGQIPYRRGADRWEDRRSYDAEMYRNQMMISWGEANTTGIKAADPSRLVLIGFLQELMGCNKLQAVKPVDIANFHSYTSLDSFSADVRLFDRRFTGKGVSVGEFGSIVDHDARTNGLFTDQMQLEYYLTRLCYLFGAGGAFICNWSWKEIEEAVFPWGLIRQNIGVPKSMAGIYRNMALLVRNVMPLAKLPKVWLMIPLDNLCGGEQETYARIIYQQAWQLMEAGIPFCTVDDQHLNQTKEQPDVVIYPCPMVISDPVMAYLQSFLQRGGRLLTSADMAYDNNRKRTQSNRMEQLCGVKVTGSVTAKPWQPGWESVKMTTATARPLSGIHRTPTGKGECLYTRQTVWTANALSTVKLRGNAIPGTHVLPLAEKSGYTSLFGVTRTARSKSQPERTLPFQGGAVKASDEAYAAFYARLNPGKQLMACLTHGPVTTSAGVLTPAGAMGVMSLDTKPLTAAGSLVAMGMGTSTLTIEVTRAGYVMLRGRVDGGKWVNLQTINLSPGRQTISEVEQELFVIASASQAEAATLRLIDLLHLTD
ncbi:MAG: cellulase family glycosylhydrolase [Armatimonadota bacterium]